MEEAEPQILGETDSLDHREVSRTVTTDLWQDQGDMKKRDVRARPTSLLESVLTKDFVL